MIRRFTVQRWIEAYAMWREYEEAKRALANICHHANCGSGFVGTDALPGEPKACWQGDKGQPACLRVYQHNRIQFLHDTAVRLAGGRVGKRRNA